MLTIGEVSKMFQLPISTLRYYDQEGLLPNLMRVSGQRMFNEANLESLHMIECLKASGLGIREIKQFMTWCAQGKETYALRKQLFVDQLDQVEEQIAALEEVKRTLEYKCWYYEEALKQGNEDFAQQAKQKKPFTARLDRILEKMI
ncbi:MAG: MerR family transcriptional regulator [Erysipelotrichaceae bacterium]